jgi:hypothetical protein
VYGEERREGEKRVCVLGMVVQPVIPALSRLRQKYNNLETSVDYLLRPCVKRKVM